MSDQRAAGAFRVGFVPGVTLTKWSRVWEERHPRVPLEIFHVDAADPALALREGRADVVFARLPIEADGFSVIPLYDEQPVAVLPKEHPLAEAESVVLADLAGERRFDQDPTLDLVAAVEVVETGAGVAVMPQSLGRLYARKGVVSRFVTDLPATTIALVWPEEATTPEVEDFIGVVRGRTANSSRARRDESEAPAASKTAKKGAADRSGGKPGSAARPARARGPQRGSGRGGNPRGGTRGRRS
ncbi:Hca operon transcriptional activator HcaR [Frondihabitans sp. 762G35]|uniref:LysR family substrate-binding domain-containing protein n=1 Tax=Frondihabitans sp. 762G35 TaxID=1446794 RepID=UPI000D20D838|nr:LysR family substrate-binding domain-containing protein [Frondihabitans sp. 762G35]ARC55922.1 Hca operon transcriptional activator HcaR [Frondihabitans sp. 762G35]